MAGGIRERHIPQRTCVGCRQVQPKRALIRVVRNPEGRVLVDPTGKAPGRGAYLCARKGCWQAALAKGGLSHALKVQIAPEDRERLVEFLEGLVEEPAVDEMESSGRLG